MKYLAKFHSREKATILLIYTEFKPTQIDPPRSNVGDVYCYWVALFTPQKLSIVSHLSWDLQCSQENLKTILLQNFGGGKQGVLWLM